MRSFTKRWPNTIISNDGFKVKYGNRGTIIYIENNKKIIAISELLSDGGILLSKDSLLKWTTCSNEIITESKQKEIIQNISDALKFDNTRLEIV